MNTLRTLFVALVVTAGATPASAQLETAFTYQGQISDTNGPINRTCEFIFGLYDAGDYQIGALLTNTSVAVTDGRFTVLLDFGPESFRSVMKLLPRPHNEGPGEWLEIQFRERRTDPWILLAPRQRITAAPFATALTAPLDASALAGAYNKAVNFSHSSNRFQGIFSGSGSNLTSVDAATVGGLPASSFWRVTGNPGTTPGAHFVGTSDGQPLELRVNAQRALRLEPNATSPNLIGGHPANWISSAYSGAVIAGGGSAASSNRIAGNYGFIGGGAGNLISNTATYASIAGGGDNAIMASTFYTTIGGGRDNTIAPFANYGTIGGGRDNVVAASAQNATISGGTAHLAADVSATISGGEGNTAGELASVGGGTRNLASGLYATIGGGRSNAAINASATVAGGFTNTAAGSYSAVGGGIENRAAGSYSVVAGGEENVASAGRSTVGGGSGNLATSSYSTIAGGRDNAASGGYAAVAGGYNNAASGTYAAVPGGYQNQANGSASFAAGRNAIASHDYSFIWNSGATATNTTGASRFEVHAASGSFFYLGTNALWASGDMSCATLTIRGGADLAEPFAMSDAAIRAGSVVVIDAAQPGRLKLSTRAYDHAVAGIVSGAGGVQPGISMIQTEKLEAGLNVALSGRVFAWVDAGQGAVEPGDLLTTSDTPGHAMKATDGARRSGAVLGKAMTPLREGRGLVLVLVSLQ